ncbi:hypothetical protein FNV43_RR03778 [Rhamnella rubrinervis]|uniref:Leucine-rich repeat-containing N-terminal plant-type domain-containing protein n=1 Tax=Rhamnella rubrinervis TaxID=2594499 RepID=A0A8K0MPL8_9ROSA|nr:hypothetical protein FNV43_RR03778 [Rhamnella rubrinervis]
MCKLGCFLFFFLNFQVLFVTCSSASSSSSPALCPEDQSSALLEFKNTFSIDSYASIYSADEGITTYPKTNSWKEGTDCCKWDGVKCENETGNVIGLDLSCSWLQGPIYSNSSLFLLSHLQTLSLAYNNLQQSQILPEFASLLVSLTHLNLSFCNLNSQVPLELSHLSGLVSLDLSVNNPLTLESSVWESLLQNLTQLREIVLDQVDMSSIAPSSLLNLSFSLTTLSLNQCYLKGEIPGRIVSLPKLQKLFTNISRQLPDSISDLKSLQYLDLAGCEFSGSIPSSMGNLTGMRFLNLGSNSFSGQIPHSFSNLGQLTILCLSQNRFTGQIPDIFGNLSELAGLSLSSNYLEGKLPQSIFNLTQLYHLELSDNRFEGPVPSKLTGLPSLIHLDLSNNSLNGTLPDFVNVSSLEILLLQSNKFSGIIPRSIIELMNLTELNLSSNNLSGVLELNMFSKLQNLTKLTLSYNSQLSTSNTINPNHSLPLLGEFYLSSCNISDFPLFLKALKNLTVLDISNNQIQGNVPNWLFDVGRDSLIYLNLSLNMLTSLKQIPWNKLQTVDLHSNLLQGPLVVPSSPSSISLFSISDNKLTGEIPSAICSMSSLQVLDLSSNRLTGVIPQCLGNLSEYLSVLDLRMNNFHGTIPTTFAEGNRLRNLGLNGNQLEGPIPHQLLKCQSLEVLDLGHNNLTGTFPEWLESLPELQVLVLRSNKFYGGIGDPKISSPFPKLRIIDVSHNNFDGPLPQKYIEKAVMNISYHNAPKYMGELYYRDSVQVTIKDLQIELVSIITIFTTIDFSSNSFGGQIPRLIGKLKSLKGLNLSHNQITGSIPSSLGNLTNLEGLDLSSNELVGEIPLQMADYMTSLAVLNLSHNYLVGRIPSGKQFNTFENDSYAGNLGLCGLPLSKKCGRDEEQTSPPEEESDGSIRFDRNYAFIGYGCGMVIGISIGYMALSRTKYELMIAKMARGGQWSKTKRRRQKQRVNTRGRR